MSGRSSISVTWSFFLPVGSEATSESRHSLSAGCAPCAPARPPPRRAARCTARARRLAPEAGRVRRRRVVRDEDVVGSADERLPLGAEATAHIKSERLLLPVRAPPVPLVEAAADVEDEDVAIIQRRGRERHLADAAGAPTLDAQEASDGGVTRCRVLAALPPPTGQVLEVCAAKCCAE